MVSLVEFLTARDAPLTDFLAQRLDEDEAVARKAVLMRDRTKFARGHEPEVPDMSAWANDDVLGGAVVSVGPERVLAEVEAKRRIVEQCTHDGRMEPTEDSDDILDWLTLRHLAAVYADHPDYDEAWRV